VAGYTTYPVIACPPDIEKHGLPKIFSSIMTPKGVPVALVPEPENAALAAIKILALSDISLRNDCQRYLEMMRETVKASDTDIVERAKS
jgi:5-(carboxyamino)imidazole ribonucleotide mutase